MSCWGDVFVLSSLLPRARKVVWLDQSFHCVFALSFCVDLLVLGIGTRSASFFEAGASGPSRAGNDRPAYL